MEPDIGDERLKKKIQKEGLVTSSEKERRLFIYLFQNNVY